MFFFLTVTFFFYCNRFFLFSQKFSMLHVKCLLFIIVGLCIFIFYNALLLFHLKYFSMIFYVLQFRKTRTNTFYIHTSTYTKKLSGRIEIISNLLQTESCLHVDGPATLVGQMKNIEYLGGK